MVATGKYLRQSNSMRLLPRGPADHMRHRHRLDRAPSWDGGVFGLFRRFRPTNGDVKRKGQNREVLGGRTSSGPAVICKNRYTLRIRICLRLGPDRVRDGTVRRDVAFQAGLWRRSANLVGLAPFRNSNHRAADSGPVLCPEGCSPGRVYVRPGSILRALGYFRFYLAPWVSYGQSGLKQGDG